MKITKFVLLVFFIGLTFNSSISQSTPESFADLVSKVSPAVVNISTTQKIVANGQGGMHGMFPPGSPFEEFGDLFEKFGVIPRFDGDDGEARTTMSLGSGFIIDSTGYVVTNHHVIENAEEISVTLSDDSQYQAEIVGSDSKTDLALLKIKSDKPFPFVSFPENDDNSKVGDWVIAIGNPFGLGGTVTKGIISARARDIKAGVFDDFIQTDAAINSGNSGGPMFNLKGEVIGINTAIVSPSGGNVGIGFATPSSLAKPIIVQLKKNGKVIRGYLGVTFQPVTKQIADSVGLSKEIGAIVVDVDPNGPAHVAGLKGGDIITKFDGKEITKSRFLPKVVAQSEIGKVYDLEIYRNGKAKNIKVKLSEYPDTTSVKDKGKSALHDGKGVNIDELFGFNVIDLDRNTKMQLNIPTNVEGIFINKIKRNGRAGKAGIIRGDIIAEVDQKKITNVSEFQSIINNTIKENKKNVLFLVYRRGQPIYVGISIAN